MIPHIQTNRERTHDLSRRHLPTIRGGIVIISIESATSATNSFSDGFEKIFTSINPHNQHLILRYTHLSKCKRYLKKARPYERIIILTTTEDIADHDISRLEYFNQILSIMIVSCHSTNTSNIQNVSTKRILSFNDFQSMFATLHNVLDEVQASDDNLYTIFDQKQTALRNVHKRLGPFVWSQAFKNIIMAMPHYTNEARDQMLYECRAYYRRNSHEMVKILEFKRTYDPANAIYWYTKDCFVHKIINRALRTEDVQVLYIFRFFIADLCTCLEDRVTYTKNRHTSSFRVYRGSNLDRNEVEQLRVGMLVATNGFFSSSLHREVAEIFVGIDPSTGMSPSRSRNDLRQYVLFEIHVDLTETPDIVIADVSEQSAMSDEHEMIFGLGTTFIIDAITYDATHYVWHIQLVSSSEVSQISQQYNKYIHRRLNDEDATLLFGNLLVDILGDYPAAMKYFHRQMRIKAFDDELRSQIYYHLARVYRCMGLYPQALTYFKCAKLLQRRILPQSGYYYAQTLSGIALAYAEMGQTDLSLNLQTRAVKLIRTLFPENHHDIAVIYNRLSYVCWQEKQYEGAHTLLSIALPVFREKSPFNYTGLAQSLHTMGLVKRALNKLEEAFECFKEALQMRQSLLSEDHPSVARTSYELATLCIEIDNNYVMALSYAQQALKIRQARLPSSHPELIQSLKLVEKLIQDSCCRIVTEIDNEFR